MGILLRLFLNSTLDGKGNAVAHLVEALRYKPSSIPDGVIGIVH
jgi:hypothetical protein